jgi:bifunctional DNA-binding transcriptional regulator/antitoxin component of YhaV-PrlF toxin-antitoxin module
MSDPGRVDGVRVLVARIWSSKPKLNGRAYKNYRITLPVKLVDEMGLKEGDHVLVFIRKANWYHLVDWSEDPDAVNELPEAIRSEISAVEAIRRAGAVTAPSPP